MKLVSTVVDSFENPPSPLFFVILYSGSFDLGRMHKSSPINQTLPTSTLAVYACMCTAPLGPTPITSLNTMGRASTLAHGPYQTLSLSLSIYIYIYSLPSQHNPFLILTLFSKTIQQGKQNIIPFFHFHTFLHSFPIFNYGLFSSIFHHFGRTMSLPIPSR